MKKEYELTLDYGTWDTGRGWGRKMILCDGGVSSHFDIPHEQIKITMVLSDEPTKYNYEIVPISGLLSKRYYVNGVSMYLFEDFRKIMDKHFPEGCYIHIEYVEE